MRAIDHDDEMPTNRIRELRKAKGLTIEQLAELVEVSQPHLTRLETHKRMLLVPVAERIATALGVSVLEILGYDADSDPRKNGAGFAEDLIPYVVGQNDPLAGLASPNRYLFQVETDAVNKAKVYRGDIIVIDDSRERVLRVQPLEIVRVRFHPAEDFLKPISLLRQYVPPRLLITNSDKGNLPSIDMDEEDAHIVGVVVGTHRRLG